MSSVPAELKGKTRLFARLRLLPGASIGYHVHEGEEEIFYILSGSAEVTDGETAAPDRTRRRGCHRRRGGHSIACAGSSPLELLAVILLY